MKKVERLDVLVPSVPEKPIEMHSCLQCPLDKQGGFAQTEFRPGDYSRVVYLGEFVACDDYSSLFACYYIGRVHIWRGKLNDGVI